jgi:hypothetical protein
MEECCSSKGCSSNSSSCSSNESCCPTSACCCPCHAKHCEEDQHDAFASCLLEAADEAWMEVLKDKIKEHILSTQNDRMSELAKIVSEGNSQRWKNKMEKKAGCSDFKEKLCNFFGQNKK